MRSSKNKKSNFKEGNLTKRLIFAVVVCLLAGSAAMAEDQKPGYPFEVVKKSGVATFAAKSYDEVWAAVIKTMVASNYKLAISEKDAGIIEGEHVRAESTRAWVGKDADEPHLSAVVEAKGLDVVVTLKWTRGEKILFRSVASQQKKVYGEFFQAVADILYPPEGAA
jgi:hypothetical protein